MSQPSTTPPRFALDPPPGPVTTVSDELISRVIDASRRAPRKRMILPFHTGPETRLHRMLNAIQPGSYIRPHRHFAPPKDESVVVLRGDLGVLIFDEQGGIVSLHRIRAGHTDFGIDLHAGVIHTLVALEPDTVVFEVKPGPYTPATDKEFLDWAPEEGHPETAAMVQGWEEMLRAE